MPKTAYSNIMTDTLFSGEPFPPLPSFPCKSEVLETPLKQSIVMSRSVCLSVCLSAHISQHISLTNFTTFSVYSLWPWLSHLLAALRYMLRTSGFVDDII